MSIPKHHPGAAFLVAFLITLLVASATETDQPLAQVFANPPGEYAPKLWWRWRELLDEQFPLTRTKEPSSYAKIDEALLTRDLETYAAGGLHGVQWGPRYPARPLLDRVFGHAARECARLGMVIDIHTEPGNAGTGGEWNDADHAMQFLTYSLTRVRGGARLSLALPPPPANPNIAHIATDTFPRQRHYREFRTIAFPDPDPETAAFPATITLDPPAIDAAALGDGNPANFQRLRLPKDATLALTCDLGEPRPVRAFLLHATGVFTGEVSVSDDGANFRPVRMFAKRGRSQNETTPAVIAPFTIPFSAPPARCYRLTLRPENVGGAVTGLGEVALISGARVDRLPEQALWLHAYEIASHGSLVADADLAVDPASVVDLTDRLKPDGTLEWDAPPGRWVVMRIGHTNTGIGVAYGVTDALRKGFQADKLSREAMDHHFRHWLEPLLAAAGPEGRKGVNALWVDSWEIDSQNWTPRMPEEFAARNGYDLARHLPAFAGFLVTDRAHTEKFWWDWRRTIAEMIADNYFGYVAQIAHRHGLKYEAQVYGNQQGDIWDPIQVGGRVDVVQNEIWGNAVPRDARIVGIPSAANVYGRGILAGGEHLAQWFSGQPTVPPARLKAPTDKHFALGINQLTYATFNPGSLDPEWSRYVARCQVLLRAGPAVSDICYLYGEGAPLRPNTRKIEPPPGYRFDYCSAEAILAEGTHVEHGQLVLSSGTRYRLLLLPPDLALTPALLRRVDSLVRAGLPVAGLKPAGSPRFGNNPDGDAESRRLADQLWGIGGPLAASATPRKVGAGRLYPFWDAATLARDRDAVVVDSFKSRTVAGPAEIRPLLEAEGILPDLEVPATMHWIHRRGADGRDIYFVAQSGPALRPTIRFRQRDRTATLWDPVTGTIRPLELTAEPDGRSSTRLELPDNGSRFVVFAP